MSEVIENAGVVVPDRGEQLARDFVSLIFPRLINEFTENTQYQIEALYHMKAESLKSGENSDVAKELNAAQVRLKKALSSEVMSKVMDKMVLLLKDVLTPEELEYAIFQEQITIKIHSVAAQLDAAFKEAIGED